MVFEYTVNQLVTVKRQERMLRAKNLRTLLAGRAGMHIIFCRYGILFGARAKRRFLCPGLHLHMGCSHAGDIVH